MSPIQVTVLGGTGFLGSVIVQTMRSMGWQVRIGARRPGAADHLGGARSIARARCDVRDEASLRRAFEGSRAVVNAVGLYLETGDETFEAVHAEGAAHVARSAARAGIECLVHISGIGAQRASASSYVRARAEGEHRVREAFPDAIIVRPSVLFGRGDAFVGAIDAASKWSPVFPLFGRGSTRMQPVHVAEVAAAVAALVENPVGRPREFELGGKRVLTYRQIVEAVLACRGRRRLLLPVPFALWMLQAKLLARLPSPPLTEHQVILMRSDNVASADVAGLAELGIDAGDLMHLLPAVLGSSGGTLPRA